MEVEILAPGGSREAIYAAIYSGADAVYTGTSRFSARAFADNPDVDELCRILDFAHLHGKKIYLTVNTLLTEEELEKELYGMLKPLYESGLDAVIVQDFGVLDFIHEHFPGLSLHASTQMSILTAEGADLLKPYGVNRVVPARELSIDEIRDMRGRTDMEIEVFVHGALCYCYSGQCLLSKVIGGRSGNRGMCAQPCRLPYEADGKRAGYVLSPKDLCTLPKIGQLIEAGVDSFKIEGRMKKAAYTAYTSYLYRTYADAYLSGVDIGENEVRRDVQKLADIYNRGGFSGGYLFEPSKKNIIDTKRNGHYGVCVGEVTRVNKSTVEYRVDVETNAQDVLEFRDEAGKSVYEYTVKEGEKPFQTVITRFQKGSSLKPGQKVYRTKNNRLLDEIGQQVEEGKKNSRLKLCGTFAAKQGERVSMELCYGDIKCAVYGETAERALTRPVDVEDIAKRLRKTGESEFEFESLQVEVEEGLFLPLGSIAALRRHAFEELTAKILEPFQRKARAHMDQYTPSPQSAAAGGVMPERKFTIIGVSGFGQIEGVKLSPKVNAYNTRFHFKLDEFAPEEWKRLPEAAKGFSYYVSLPAVLRRKNTDVFLQLWNEHGSCFQEEHCAGVIVHSIEALSIVAKMGGIGRELLASPLMYMWNQRTGTVYSELGIGGHIYMAYGRTPVMTTEGCVSLELGKCRRDGRKRKLTISTPKKDEFTVVNYCDYCYNMIYEKNPHWHEPEDLAEFPEINFTFEDADEVRKVLERWNFL